MRKLVILIGCIMLSFMAGAIGSLATIPNIPAWYAGLDKPPYLPPNEVFGPVWSVLYLLVGVALFLVITSQNRLDKRTAYTWFGVQLGLNALWSIVFFGLHLPWLGVAVIVVLIGAAVITARSFYRFSQWAAYILIPYIAWCCFATYLNTGVAVLN